MRLIRQKTKKLRNYIKFLTYSCLGFFIPVNVAQADILALVVGVDDYQYTRKLCGAVNDANDIENALRNADAQKVIKLIDAEVSRETILTNLDALIDQAKPGDTVIFTFAGHGSQIQASSPNDEEDGLDEILVMPAYRSLGENRKEKIIDNEIEQRLNRRKDIRVIFVADSCHSGTINRSGGRVDDCAMGRYTDDMAMDFMEDEDFSEYENIETDIGSQTYAPPPEHMIVLTATEDGKLTPEVLLDGERRGALSWSFANAFRGKADRDGNGTDLGELKVYVEQSVRQHTDQKQLAAVHFKQDPKKPLIESFDDSTEVHSSVKNAAVAVEIIGAKGQKETISKQLKHVRFTNTSNARLVWNFEEKTVLNSSSDFVAHNVSRAEVFQAVVEKWLAVDFLKTLQPIPLMLNTDLLPHNGEHCSIQPRLAPINGQFPPGQIRFVFDPAGAKSALLLNIASRGEVQFVGRHKIENGQNSLDGDIIPPFGMDHAIIILSSKEKGLDKLSQTLETMDGNITPVLAAREIEETLKNDKTAIIGIHAWLSAPQSSSACKKFN